MPRLPNSATPRNFADALRQTLEPLAARIATGDGRISKADAKRALKEGGISDVARDGLEKIAREGVMSVSDFVEAQTARALKEAEAATGGDGRLSKRDAEKLPADLRLAFHVLRDGPFATELGARVPSAWRGALDGQGDALNQLDKFLKKERAAHEVYPPAAQVFAALERTPPSKVKVVVVGQDPYHGPGEANGLCFSVSDGVKIPPSLRNIFKELAAETGQPAPTSGNLEPWADRGVLLLNTALTVEKDKPASHAGKGWESVTDAILRDIAASDQPVVFLALGKHAKKLIDKLDTTNHSVVERAHPSPLSASRGFLGTAPFGEINDALKASGRGEIDWSL